VPDLHIAPEQVLIGLAHADRENLCTLIALYEETYLQKIVLDMLKDAGTWMAKKIKKKIKGEQLSEQNDLKKAERKKAFERRLADKSEALKSEHIATDSLRLRLWMHLRSGLGLPANLSFYRVTSQDVTKDIAERTQQIFAKQLDDEDVRKLKFFSKEYWKDFAKVRLNPFTKKTINDPTFPDVVRLNTLSIIADAAQQGTLPSELQTDLTERVTKIVEGMDENDKKQLLSHFDADELTESSAMKILVGARGLFSLGFGKELARLAAYILVANSSAVMPLLGGSALVGTTTVLANPLFVVPVMLLGGVFVARNLKKRVREAFGIAVTTVLVLWAVSEQKQSSDPMLKVFRNLPAHLPEEVNQICHEILLAEKELQESKTEVTSSGGFKSAAKKFGSWAKDSFASEAYPDALEYIKCFTEIKIASDNLLFEKAEAKVKASHLNSKLSAIDKILDQLAEPGTGSGKPEAETAVEGHVFEDDTIRNAEPLDEMAFEGEDTDPDPPADGKDVPAEKPGSDLNQNLPDPPLTDWKGQDLSDTTLEEIELIEDPREEAVSDDEDLVESPTHDLKPALRAQKAAAAKFAQSTEGDEFKKNRDRAQTVQGKPSLDLLAQTSEDRDPTEPDHRATVQGKPLLDLDEKKKAGLPVDEDE